MQVPLRRRDGSIRAYALVDDDDAHLVTGYRWSDDGNGYACRYIREGMKIRRIAMHRMLMGLTDGDGMSVDHINRNSLDNRRSNLRIVDHRTNCLNVASQGGTSQHRGVYLYKGKWRAKVAQTHLGTFATEEDAAAAALAERLRRGAVD